MYQQQPQPQLIPANMVNRVNQQLTYSLVVQNNKRHLKKLVKCTYSQD